MGGRRYREESRMVSKLTAPKQLEELPLVLSGKEKLDRHILVFVFMFLFLFTFTHFITLLLDFTPNQRAPYALCNV